MNKSQLVEALAEESSLPLRESASVVDTILETVIESLVAGHGVEIRGFGSFVVKEYDSYLGRNPKTGATFEVPPKKLPFFKVGKDLKDKLNQK